MKEINEMNDGFVFIADSNEGNLGYSFSPSELYADKDGNCVKVTCSGVFQIMDIFYYTEMGFWGVPGDEIKSRFLARFGRLPQLSETAEANDDAHSWPSSGLRERLEDALASFS